MVKAGRSNTFFLHSIWVAGGADVETIEKTAEWYKSVFGMQETQRFGSPQLKNIGISLNFGQTVEEAKKARFPVMGIAKSFMGQPGAPGNDNIVRPSFNVTNIDAVMKRVVKGRGKIVSGPDKKKNGMVAVVKDPVGNWIELVSPLPVGKAAQPLQISWRTVHVPAVDAEQTARFYAQIFGVKEIARGGTSRRPEIMLNFGASAKAAQNNASAPLTVVSVKERPRPTITTMASYLTIGFRGQAELDEALNRAYKAGAVFVSEPHYFKEVNTIFARLSDPNGNFVEFAGRN
ncbi:MAG: VOC family protein [Deltaproteobacteria bacterium]|nr:VOC family protein [Deltaproteobacteria bacterium]